MSMELLVIFDFSFSWKVWGSTHLVNLILSISFLDHPKSVHDCISLWGSGWYISKFSSDKISFDIVFTQSVYMFNSGDLHSDYSTELVFLSRTLKEPGFNWENIKNEYCWRSICSSAFSLNWFCGGLWAVYELFAKETWVTAILCDNRKALMHPYYQFFCNLHQ